LLIQIGRDTMHCQTAYDAKDLLEKISNIIDQAKDYEQDKMKYISILAIEIFGLLKHRKKKRKFFSSSFFKDLMKVIIE